jgi:hypothetical protein
MRTPSGIECAFFYGNYFRGKSDEECRLIGKQKAPNNWTPDLCLTCPIPGILRANACKNLSFTPLVGKKWLLGKRQVTVTAFCSKSNAIVKTPQVGCGLCHPLDEINND